MTTRLSSLIDDIEACFDSLSLTTSGPDELRQKLAALRKAVALPAVVGEEAVFGWVVKSKLGNMNFIIDPQHANSLSREGREVTAVYTRSPTRGREAGLEEALRALVTFLRGVNTLSTRGAEIEISRLCRNAEALLPSEQKARADTELRHGRAGGRP